ncbi:SpoIIE family protein phosphatase [Streptacidiphilus sp. ASG 303]|uniref:SpoIIE family protein phosphatase n=1 Tax=Streptacidiphilus sp. ASG 303 TaxID=2896847 RepID=UPI001E3DDE92|nr:SpoIIE family protein phosphatase [Streptacidiphilus sp. ASG 303]MCD0484468.1 SpoIIE family protein phosphatase [Streptacidiphilus sp. ASG 303]
MSDRDVLMRLDTRGVVVEWSPEAERLLGRTAAEALGRAAAALGPFPDGAADLRLEVRPVPRADGAAVWEVTARPAGADRGGEGGVDGGDAAAGGLGAALVEALFTQSPVGLHLLDPELRLLRFNAAASGVQGTDPGGLLGHPVTEVYPLCEPTRAEPMLREVLATGMPVRNHLVRCGTVADPGRKRSFALSAFRLLGRDRRVLGLAVSVVDVTEQERSRARLVLLGQARTAIGRTMDMMRTADELAGVTTPGFADATAVDLLDSLARGSDPPSGPVDPDVPLRRAAFRSRQGLPGTLPVGNVGRYPFPTPFTQSLADRQPRLVRSLDGEGQAWLARDPERARQLRAAGVHSLVVVPLVLRGAVLGLAAFYRSGDSEPYDQDDLPVAADLAARTALCVDNARRYTREHMVAVTLQRELVRCTPPEQAAAEIAHYYLPAGAGGDWFDVIPLSGARVALVVGDVAGHGLRAAATMARLRTAIDALAVLDLEPDELLARLDDTALRIAEEGSDWPPTPSGGSDLLLATCLYTVYDPLSRRFTAASAGHPAPLLTRPDGTVEEVGVPVGPPLGKGGLPFDAVELELAEGSLLTLYTPGLLRGATTGEAGRPGGTTELLRRAVARHDRPLRAIRDEAVYGLLPSRPEDDAVLLLARTRTLDPARVATWSLPFETSSAAAARRLVRERLAAWGLGEEASAAELVVSELVTNAVRHGAAPLRLRLIRDRALTCEVFDGSDNAPRLRHARANDEGGRGLFIVARLAQGWGTRYTSDGKVIWAQLAAGRAPGEDPDGRQR